MTSAVETSGGTQVSDRGDPRVDGRSARAERTRQAIVDSLLSLLEEGDLQPTASRIAERAGISLRLIYHHFGDLESLFRSTTERQAERMAAMHVPIDRGLPLPERLDEFCSQRALTLEWITPVRRAALLHEPFSAELRRARDLLLQRSELQVATLFADVLDQRCEPERSEVLHAACAIAGWSAWDAMRARGLEPEDARAAVRRALGALFADQDRRGS